MQNAKQTLDMTPIGMIFEVVKSPEQTKGRSLEMEWQLMPKSGGTPVHIHPTASETYKVLEGQLEVCLDGKWQTLNAGEEVIVVPGTPHTFRNPSSGMTRVYNTHAPAMQFAEYFTGLHNIVHKLSGGGTNKLSMNFNTITHLSMLMKKHNKELVSVSPPNMVVSLLSRIGRLTGLKV